MFSVPNDGTILEITPLDVAVLEDLGYPLIKPKPAFCFSGKQTIDVKGVGVIQMYNLRVGDEVLIHEGQYEPVYAFGHRQTFARAQYLKLEPSGLELTPNHMVFVNGDHRSIPAMSVRVGDQLIMVKSGQMISQTVTAIQTVVREGAFAPFTRSGCIIVSDVNASTFIAFQEAESLTIGGVPTGLTFQWLAHTALLPLSWFAASCSSWFAASCSDFQTDASEGMLTYLIDSFKFALWLFDRSDVVLALIAVPMAMVLILVAALELAYKNRSLTVFGIILLGTYIALRDKRFVVQKSIRKKHC